MKAGMDGDKKLRRNYKLLVDPMIRGGSQKIYRFDGIDPTVTCYDLKNEKTINYNFLFMFILAHMYTCMQLKRKYTYFMHFYKYALS